MEAQPDSLSLRSSLRLEPRRIFSETTSQQIPSLAMSAKDCSASALLDAQDAHAQAQKVKRAELDTGHCKLTVFD